MSHAEYAPKRLPVLTRLAMAIRQLPAVEFALAKFKTLLRVRTNEEPAVTSALLAPAPDVANGSFTDAIADEPVESKPAAGDSVQSDASEMGATIAIETVEIAAIAPDAVEMAPAAADFVADETPAADVMTRNVSEPPADPVEPDAVVIEAAAVQPPAIGGVEADRADMQIIAEPSDETAAEVAETAAIVAPLYALAEDRAELADDEAPTAVGETKTDALAAEPVEMPAVEPVVANLDPLSDREALIRRRWSETGIMMWRGAGQSTLCIQGSAALLPPKPGETMPQYDRLEFRLIDGLIVCEGFVVEAPMPLKNRSFARAA